MASDWTQNGPISLPPRPLAYGVGALIALLALTGVALGLRAAWREPAAPGLGADASQNAAGDDAIAAQPIVELPPPVTAPAPTPDETKPAAPTDEEKARELAAQTAAAQAVQAKPSKPPADIDDILTSASEKPPAPIKPSTDEAPPSTQPKTDVPF
jgi:hypothetical protein